MDNQNGKRNRAHNGAISIDLIYWMDWDNAGEFRLFSTFLYAENKRLFSINEGRKEGLYDYIPDGWFDFEESRLAEIMGLDERNVRKYLNGLKELGLILIQQGNKRKKATANNGRKTLKKNLYKINWELMERLDAKYQEKRISVDEIKKEYELMVQEDTPTCYSENKAVEAPKRNKVSNPTEEAKEGQIEAKEEETEPVVRTLEEHPEEDEELIGILFRIVDNEDPDALIQEFCNGHNESAELMQHYYNLYKQDKASELVSEDTGKASELDSPENDKAVEPDFDEKMTWLFNWYIRKGKKIGYEIMYEGLDQNTVVQDIYSYDEVKDLFNSYKKNFEECAA